MRHLFVLPLQSTTNKTSITQQSFPLPNISRYHQKEPHICIAKGRWIRTNRGQNQGNNRNCTCDYSLLVVAAEQPTTNTLVGTKEMANTTSASSHSRNHGRRELGCSGNMAHDPSLCNYSCVCNSSTPLPTVKDSDPYASHNQGHSDYPKFWLPTLLFPSP